MFRYREAKEDSLVNAKVQATIKTLIEENEKKKAHLLTMKQSPFSPLIKTQQLEQEIKVLNNQIDEMRYINAEVNRGSKHRAYFLQNLANQVADKWFLTSVTVYLDRLTRAVTIELISSISEKSSSLPKIKFNHFKSFAIPVTQGQWQDEERELPNFGKVLRGLLIFDYAFIHTLLNTIEAPGFNPTWGPPLPPRPRFQLS